MANRNVLKLGRTSRNNDPRSIIRQTTGVSLLFSVISLAQNSRTMCQNESRRPLSGICAKFPHQMGVNKKTITRRSWKKIRAKSDNRVFPCICADVFVWTTHNSRKAPFEERVLSWTVDRWPFLGLKRSKGSRFWYPSAYKSMVKTRVCANAKTRWIYTDKQSRFGRKKIVSKNFL